MGKINGWGEFSPIPVIQAPGERIVCRRCGQKKTRYKRDFPYCYECYTEMIRRGELYDE